MEGNHNASLPSSWTFLCVILRCFLLLLFGVRTSGWWSNRIHGQFSHLTYYCCGVVCLFPFWFCKIFLQLLTNRTMNIPVTSSITTDPWMCESLFACIPSFWIDTNQVRDEVFGRVRYFIPVWGIKFKITLQDLSEQIGIHFICGFIACFFRFTSHEESSNRIACFVCCSVGTTEQTEKDSINEYTVVPIIGGNLVEQKRERKRLNVLCSTSTRNQPSVAM